jgi:hypothetical protein
MRSQEVAGAAEFPMQNHSGGSPEIKWRSFLQSDKFAITTGGVAGRMPGSRI